MQTALSAPRSGSLLRPNLLFAVVILLLLGLIGMHSVSGSFSTHPAPSLETVSSAVTAESQSIAESASSISTDSPLGCDLACVSMSAPSHGDMEALMFCVLALLAGLLFLARPAQFRMLRAAIEQVDQLFTPMRSAPAALRPSLHSLSISRT